MMRAIGRLDDRITIKSLAVTQGDFGEAIEGYSTFATVWGHVMYKGGSESLQNDKEVGKQNIEILIRYLSGINLRMKVEHNSTEYDIKSIAINGRNESMILRVQEVI